MLYIYPGSSFDKDEESLLTQSKTCHMATMDLVALLTPFKTEKLAAYSKEMSHLASTAE